MKMKQMYLTDRQIKVMAEKAKTNDISFSEVVRRVLDEWIDANSTAKSITL